MAITLYGASLSPFVRKVCVALAEKDLPFEQVQIDPSRLPDDYYDLNPLGRIPALKDDAKALADSAVIVAYLDRQYPQQPLSHADPYLQAKVQWFEKYADYELAPLTTFGVFRQRVLMPLRKQPQDEAVVQTSLEQLPSLLDYLEASLQDNDFMVGDRLTVADIAIASQFVNFGHGREKIDHQRWPQLTAYVERLHQRPSFAQLIAAETALVNKLLGR
ncbi:MAG: glutathione S-transferase [Pseudomonadales bacterium]|nr:glutathione S-transferase [Pseudomonadales bacterium]MAR92991.1 glutathione S-transferase [Pseudomonadales bacterium]